MQQNRHPGIQVVIPDHGTTNGVQRSLRPLAVDEALQFSPMTSAPVFGLDSILRPDIGQPSLTNISSTHDRQTAGNIIDALDNETQANGAESERLETTRQYLQHLLNEEHLTEFKFKVPLHLRKSQRHSLTPQSDTESRSRDHLGPFARLVLDSTDVAYRYPLPTTPSPTKELPAAGKALPTPTSEPRASVDVNREAFLRNQSLSNHTTERAVKPVVMVPALPSSSQPDEYVDISDRLPPKRRKLDIEEDPIAALRLRDQKAEADIALVRLQELFQDIFEAEDELQPDTSSAEIRSSSKYFRPPNTIEDVSAVLTSESHSLLQKSIQKVKGYGRLGDIPTEYLNRVQKLCENPIIAVQSLDLRLDDHPNDDGASVWVQRLEDMRNALLAICTLLHTMSGDLGTKNLCPEDLIQAIPRVLNLTFDQCIIPAVECRPSGRDSSLFGFFAANKQILASLTSQTKRLLSLFGLFLSKVDVAEGTITATEFHCTKLIFVENAYNDRDSAIGFQKFEAVRRGAMDVLAKIFAKYPDQRAIILDEILVSLEKLPSTRQSARQFKLIDGKSIQLLSALVMQLVQTTALQKSSKKSDKSSRRVPAAKHDDDDDDSESSKSDDGSDYGDTSRLPPLQRLFAQVEPLYDNAARNAQYITKFIVQRAMTSTKTGDQPFRNILDLFTEDLISVLGSTDWPAAELLLRVLASQMVGIAEHDKSPANAKNMALELLGWMGSAISDLSSTAQHLLPSVDDGQLDLTEYLRQLYDDRSNRSLHLQDLVSEDGPYRIVLEYLEERGLGSWQLSSARGYLVAQWAKTTCNVYNDPSDSAAGHAVGDDLGRIIGNILSDSKWLETHSAYDSIPTQHARFAYLLLVLSTGFCKAFDTIIKVLLNSITSDQAKVRSRSLKSVIQMLERDPTLLDRDDSIMALILRCATDSSPMVRDSALSLIAKCITLRPGLEEDGCRTILACASDPTIGVRKRCIGLLRDIYAQTSRKELKLAITESLLQRIMDHENNVVVQARQVLEEMWLSPFHHTIDQDSPQTKVSLKELVELIVGSVQQSDGVVATLEAFLRNLLSGDTKAASSNFKVCKSIVASMFELVVDNSDSADKVNVQALLQSITVFAKANAKLFTPDQLEILHPYIGHLATADDLLVFRSVVVIYRCVLPYLSTAHNTLLKDVQNDLFKSVSKLARAELNEVMACLWTINGVLQNTERLVKLTISVLKGINQAKGADFNDPSKTDILNRVRSYIRIAGCVGKHCDLDKFENYFKQSFPSWAGGSVAGLMADFIAPFAMPQHPLSLRVMALESLGSICQTWPAQYSREQARLALTSVFKEGKPDLENIVLKAFLEFFSIHEGRSEKLVETGESTNDNETSTRLGGSLKASDNDGAAAIIAQHFLQNMLSAALAKQESYALTAIELIASINRQGLIHPKECAGVLVSLETSTNPAIAKIAFDTHKMLHEQHESMFDREYMRAVQDAFCYQRDVIGDPSGAYNRPYTAKLAPLFEIVRVSNSKYQRKFLSNLCSKVDFDVKELDVSGNPPDHLLLARFVCQNLAFFEYGQIAELLPTILRMEKIVGATGTAVAHAIDAEIFPPKVEEAIPNPEPSTEQIGAPPPGPPSQAGVDPKKLRQVATASAVLLILWEARSYLRRLYGINFHARQREGKTSAKELNRAPAKVQGITGDKFWETVSRLMSCLDTPEAMFVTCREFSMLMSIDDELKVSADDDPDAYDMIGDMDGMDTSIRGGLNGPKSTKRKSSVSGGTAPKPKKPRARLSGVKKRATTESDDEIVMD
ncbi:hypothetical protein AJ80_01438 [Polytolypa hystricis UAMH7299]|uniref:Sister chromatid cohesion protein n=1 Tax=Polytolypa hystricis (strain UAMH7299) TaxID=1447883 RepID=A0A2B7Z1Z2_POLH7|nr:hypothetical protein AJ80_01438 [Polytolypa hystricis UAMH7299]